MVQIPRSDPPKRQESFDISKGVLIFLVILGHALQFLGHHGGDGFWTDPLFMLIYMFHMPLFAAYSGYFAPQRQLSIADLISRARVLIYPMMIWSLIFAALFALKNKDPEMFSEVAISSFAFTFWFLWAVFLAFCLLWVGQRFSKYAPLFWVGAWGTLMLLPEVWRVVPMTAFIFPFFIGGYLVRSSGRLFSPWRSIPVQLGLFLVAVLCFLIWDPATYSYANRSDFVRFPQEVAVMFIGGSAATILAVQGLAAFGRWVQGSWAGASLAKLGRVTLELYVLQSIFFAGSGALGARLSNLIGDQPLVIWGACFGLALVITALLYGCVRISRFSARASSLLWGR